MKLLSLLLIALYLFLPVACLTHPCGHQEELTTQQSIELTTAVADECPENDDSDHCENTCCCAGHLPFSPVAEPFAIALITRKSPFNPYLVLPRLIDRIFVPPQNLS